MIDTNMNIEMIPVNEINPYANNPRKITKDAVKAVKASLEKYGIKQPLVVAGENNEIVVGHTRFQALQEMGVTQVPCIRADDLSEEEIQEYRIIDNKSNEKSLWDYEKLNLEMSTMNLSQEVFSLSFSKLELDTIMSPDTDLNAQGSDPPLVNKTDKKLVVTQEQFQTYLQAAQKARAANENKLTDGECFELICQYYLDS